VQSRGHKLTTSLIAFKHFEHRNADTMVNDVAAAPLKMGVDLMKAFEQVAATEDTCT
jgi:hypothetical protein